MNRLAILAGIGGLTMPVAISLSSAGVSWRTIVVAGGALSALLALACAWVPPMDPGRLKAAPTSLRRPPRVSGNQIPPSRDRRFAGQPGFAWLGLALLLGGGNEAALAGWISTYLQVAGFSASAATWVLASHWLGLIVARVLLSPRVERVKAAAIVRSAIAGAVCVAAIRRRGRTRVARCRPVRHRLRHRARSADDAGAVGRPTSRKHWSAVRAPPDTGSGRRHRASGDDRLRVRPCRAPVRSVRRRVELSVSRGCRVAGATPGSGRIRVHFEETA